MSLREPIRDGLLKSAVQYKQTCVREPLIISSFTASAVTRFPLLCIVYPTHVNCNMLVVSTVTVTNSPGDLFGVSVPLELTKIPKLECVSISVFGVMKYFRNLSDICVSIHRYLICVSSVYLHRLNLDTHLDVYIERYA